MRHVTPAEQEYLETLLRLRETDQPLTAANVSRSLGLSAPTVHEMVKRLEAAKLIVRDPQKRISFTDEGLEIAREVTSRHRLVERFLVDVLGIPWYAVHEEAETIDRYASPDVIAGMREQISSAKTCPHGHPIAAGNRMMCGVRLADAPVGSQITILRFEDEDPELLRGLHDAGVRLGLSATVADSDGERIVLRHVEGDTEIDAARADTIAVWSSAGNPGFSPAA
ncbi:MAG: metal-dependent transcriptional regulator [Patulibacter sp.]|nr:metal-dependent transcriptional regulator [Patulibacter sp.]